MFDPTLQTTDINSVNIYVIKNSFWFKIAYLGTEEWNDMIKPLTLNFNVVIII